MHEKNAAILIAILIGLYGPFLSAQSGVDLAYRLESSKIPSHGPVELVVEVKNQSQQTATLDFGLQSTQSFELSLTKPNGVMVAFTPPLKEGIALQGKVNLAPGKSLARHLMLNEWLNLDPIGSYKLQVTFTGSVELGAKPAGIDRTASLDFEITPDNRDELEQQCHELANRILTATTAADVDEAANRLAAIRDPVSVPYWGRVRRYWHLEALASSTLAKIADHSAVSELTKMLNEKDSESSALARSALTKIQKETSDREIENQVREALSRKEK
jgi:hypothetical protein